MKVNQQQALEIIKAGGVIAYPTETSYGLGCDALNTNALNRLIDIKSRCESKGLIVLIHNYQQLSALAQPLDAAQLQQLQQNWPGPFTFVLPCQPTLPALLTGNRSTLAIRMSSHPIAHQLCQNGPITSSSANISGKPVLNSYQAINDCFGNSLDGIIDGKPGGLPPSTIIDIQTGQRLR